MNIKPTTFVPGYKFLYEFVGPFLLPIFQWDESGFARRSGLVYLISITANTLDYMNNDYSVVKTIKAAFGSLFYVNIGSFLLFSNNPRDTSCRIFQSFGQGVDWGMVQAHINQTPLPGVE